MNNFESDREFIINLAFDIIMNLSTPWTPLLNGKPCPTSVLYQQVHDASPNSISHTAWAEKTLATELKKTPEARDALWESILMLWRLRLTMNKASENTNWHNLVSAWLVCIR
jgi:hypothetical protein